METPNLKNRIQFILRPETEQVRLINQKTFETYALHWAAHHRFFASLRSLEDETRHVKLYMYERLRNEKRYITDYINSYYSSEFDLVEFPAIEFINIQIKKPVSALKIQQCRTMRELEMLHIATLEDDEWVGCNPDGNGGYHIHGQWPKHQFYEWTKLIEDGFLLPDYEQKLRDELKSQNH